MKNFLSNVWYYGTGIVVGVGGGVVVWFAWDFLKHLFTSH